MCVTGISLTYSVSYEHSQNNLVEVFIKKILFITRPLFIHANHPSSFWNHVVLHAATTLRFQPIFLNDHSSFELTSSQFPNVAHLRTFGYQVWVPIAKLHRKKIGRHRHKGIYVGFDSPNIIRYVIPSVGLSNELESKTVTLKKIIFYQSKLPNLVIVWNLGFQRYYSKFWPSHCSRWFKS